MLTLLTGPSLRHSPDPAPPSPIARRSVVENALHPGDLVLQFGSRWWRRGCPRTDVSPPVATSAPARQTRRRFVAPPPEGRIVPSAAHRDRSHRAAPEWEQRAGLLPGILAAARSPRVALVFAPSPRSSRPHSRPGD